MPEPEAPPPNLVCLTPWTGPLPWERAVDDDPDEPEEADEPVDPELQRQLEAAFAAEGLPGWPPPEGLPGCNPPPDPGLAEHDSPSHPVTLDAIPRGPEEELEAALGSGWAAEGDLLSLLLRQPALLDRVAGALQSDDFRNPSNAILFAMMRDRRAAGLRISGPALEEAVQARGLANWAVTGSHYLDYLWIHESRQTLRRDAEQVEELEKRGLLDPQHSYIHGLERSCPDPLHPETLLEECLERVRRLSAARHAQRLLRHAEGRLF